MYSTPAELITYWLTEGREVFAVVIGPLILALIGAWRNRAYFTNRSVALCLMTCMVLNVVVAVPQVVFELVAGTHLLPAWPLFAMWLYRQHGIRTGMQSAYAGTWITLFIPDLVSAFAHHAVQGLDPLTRWTALTWVGGAGWNDGLLWFPLAAFVLAPVVPHFVDRLRRSATNG